MKSITVYCGSADDIAPHYLQAARAMGATLAQRGITLVYGGGKTGLMGALANGALEAGGAVIGVITEGMNTPALAHAGLTRMDVLPNIHERKARMYALGDGYLALPGGYGTLDELFETLTWAQLGFHQKPVGLLDVNGYYAPLLSMLDHAAAEGFIFPEHRRMLFCHTDPAALLDEMRTHEYPHDAVRRWMRED